MIDYFGWTVQGLATCTTLITTWRMGDKSLDGPICGLISQLFWYAVVWHYSLWGIAPITTFMVLIHGRNLWKWKNETSNN